MGSGISKDDLTSRVKGMLKTAEPKKEVVLVPPLFERDFRGRSRMTRSAYDWMFCKPGLKWLFNDYMAENQVYTLWRLRPSEDPRFTIHARLAAQGLSRDELNGLGRAALRFQPHISEPLTFVDLKAGTQRSPVLRTCTFLMDHGVGFWNVTPLEIVDETTVGLRYSSPDVSLGLVTRPVKQEIDQLWLVKKTGPLSAGVQFDLKGHQDPNTFEDVVELLKKSASYALSYTPDSTSGRANFSTALEIKEQSQMTISLLYNMAVQRLCRNPFEGHQVVGVTNYLSLGLQVKSDLANATAKPNTDGETSKRNSSIALAGSWQANKNWLVKAKLGSDSASFAVALKAWWQPSMTFALASTYDYHTRKPKIGFTYNLENYGNIRYERQGEKIRFGKALVQRHVALAEDIINKEGAGLLVREEDLNNKDILGQTQAASAQFL